MTSCRTGARLFDRRVVASVCQIGKALAALALAVGTVQGRLDRGHVRYPVHQSGDAGLRNSTMHALLPGVVPMALRRARSRHQLQPMNRSDLRALARQAPVGSARHGLRHLHRHLHRRRQSVSSRFPTARARQVT
jgi:hypothetical protein